MNAKTITCFTIRFALGLLGLAGLTVPTGATGLAATNARLAENMIPDGQPLTFTPRPNAELNTVPSLRSQGEHSRPGDPTTSGASQQALAAWREVARLEYDVGETCGQLKLDPSDHPTVLCTVTTDGVRRGFVKRLVIGAWTTLGGGAFNIDSSRSALVSRLALKVDGTPVVAWVESGERTNPVYVKELRSGHWVALGGALNIDRSSQNVDEGELALALDASGVPLVAFKEARGLYVRQFQAGTWATLGGGIVPDAAPTPYSSPSRPKLIVAADGSVHAFWMTYRLRQVVSKWGSGATSCRVTPGRTTTR